MCWNTMFPQPYFFLHDSQKIDDISTELLYYIYIYLYLYIALHLKMPWSLGHQATPTPATKSLSVAAAASHSSKEAFDEDAAMKEINERLLASKQGP